MATKLHPMGIIVFKQYTFEKQKVHCSRCEKPLWYVVANYDLIDALGDEMQHFKIVVGFYKTLKNAKYALYHGRIRKREVMFEER